MHSRHWLVLIREVACFVEIYCSHLWHSRNVEKALSCIPAVGKQCLYDRKQQPSVPGGSCFFKAPISSLMKEKIHCKHRVERALAVPWKRVPWPSKWQAAPDKGAKRCGQQSSKVCQRPVLSQKMTKRCSSKVKGVGTSWSRFSM